VRGRQSQLQSRLRSHLLVLFNNFSIFFFKARSPIFSLLSTTLDGIKEIRVYRKEDMFRKHFEDLADARSLPYLTFVKTFAWFFLSMNVLAILYQVAVILAILFLVSGKWVYSADFNSFVPNVSV